MRVYSAPTLLLAGALLGGVAWVGLRTDPQTPGPSPTESDPSRPSQSPTDETTTPSRVAATVEDDRYPPSTDSPTLSAEEEVRDGHEVPMVAAGRVVDSKGDGVSDARVAAEWVGTVPSGRRQSVSTRTHAAGEFSLRGDVGCATVRLIATHSDYIAVEASDVVVGSRDLLLRFPRSGSVTGRLLAMRTSGAHDLAVRIAAINPIDGRTTNRGRVVAVLDESGDATYRFDRLPSGRYRIEILSTVPFAKDVWWEGNVDVPAGGDVEAPLADLRESLHHFRLTVTDEQGVPVASGQGTFRGEGGEDEDFDIADGVAEIFTPHATVVAYLGAPRLQFVKIDDLSGDRRVILRRAFRVRIRLRNLSALPTPPVTLRAQLFSSLGATNWVLGVISASDQVEFDEAGEALLLAPLAAECQLSLTVATTAARQQSVRAFEPTWIAVDGRLDEQIVEVDLSSEVVAAAVGQLSSDHDSR